MMIEKRQGFSIVELLVAILIFSLLISGVFVLITNATKVSISNKKREENLYKAQELLKYLISLNYENACLSEGEYHCDSSKCCGEFYGDSNLKYKVVLKRADLKEITVEVESPTSKLVLYSLKGRW